MTIGGNDSGTFSVKSEWISHILTCTVNWLGLGVFTCRNFSVDGGRCETHRWLVTENSSNLRTPVYTQKCNINHPQEKADRWDLEKSKEMQLPTPSYSSQLALSNSSWHEMKGHYSCREQMTRDSTLGGLLDRCQSGETHWARAAKDGVVPGERKWQGPEQFLMPTVYIWSPDAIQLTAN